MVNSVKNSTKVSFNETTYEFVLDKVIDVLTANDREHELRVRYKILINDSVQNDILITSTLGDELITTYTILEPYHGDGAYHTPFRAAAGKDFPMDIVFEIIKFLNK
jgi:hypothetical protein